MRLLHALLTLLALSPLTPAQQGVIKFGDDSGMFNVRRFGARGDGVTDDTAAIQAALDHAAGLAGRVWLAPSEKGYRCEGPLTVPPSVQLCGAFDGMRRGHQLFNQTPKGSLLLVHTTGDFLTLRHGSVLSGVEIHYPDQVTSGTPVPHGWTLRVPQDMHGVTIRNVCAINPYRLLRVDADGVLVEGLQGFPLETGIHLGRVADVPRIRKVHFNPNVDPDLDPSLRDWVQQNGTCVRLDWVEEFMFDSFFAYGYQRGFWFSGQLAGFPESFGSYGTIHTFGLDSVNEGLRVEHRGIAGRQGVSLRDGRIVPFAGPAPRAGIRFVDTALTPPKENPSITLGGVGFFGPHESSIDIQEGSGARVVMHGGQAVEYQSGLVRVASADARVRLFGVRSVGGARVVNPAGADVLDRSPIAD